MLKKQKFPLFLAAIFFCFLLLSSCSLKEEEEITIPPSSEQEVPCLPEVNFRLEGEIIVSSFSSAYPPEIPYACITEEQFALYTPVPAENWSEEALEIPYQWEPIIPEPVYEEKPFHMSLFDSSDGNVPDTIMEEQLEAIFQTFLPQKMWEVFSPHKERTGYFVLTSSTDELLLLYEPGTIQGWICLMKPSSGLGSFPEPPNAQPISAGLFWNPDGYSAVCEEILGPEQKEVYVSLINAVKEGNSSFHCPKEAYLSSALFTAKSSCPLVSFLTETCFWENGQAKIVYKDTNQDTEEIWSDFEQTVSILLSDAKRGNRPEEMLLFWYFHLAGQSSQRDGESSSKARFYQNFLQYFEHPAYAFTFFGLQCGADAVTAASSDGRLFSLFSTEQGWYAADLNREIQEGKGLSYFGMDEDRFLDLYNLSFSDLSLPDGQPFPKEGGPEKLSSLWELSPVSLQHKKGRVLIQSQDHFLVIQ